MHTTQWPSLIVRTQLDNYLMESSLPAERCSSDTHISDLPNVILTNIFMYVSSPRVRNCMALTCRDWYIIERQTRTDLSLRGNIFGLHELPRCFQQVTTLDLSQSSPWGSSLFQSTTNGEEIGNCLRAGFPNVIDVTVYVRDALDIQMVAWLWPDLEFVSLVRWHQRAMESAEEMDPGHEIEGLLSACKKLETLNLSKFYCWTEDIPPALQAGATIAVNLRVLNLLKLSPEGFKTQEVGAITASCPNLEEFCILCEFDHRLLDSMGDDALLAIATNCSRLRVLHLVDFNEWGALSGDPNDDGYASEDSNLSRKGLEAMFKALPHLEDLVFFLSQNMRDMGPSFEVCAAHCKKLQSLKLSHFHGICGGPYPDGVAVCASLQELSLKNCGDLTDDALRAIGVGCTKLSKLGLRHCKFITKEGLNACVGSLSASLKDVEIACCKLLPTATTLKALEPVQTSVKRLHLDCVWDEEILAKEAALAAALRSQSTLEAASEEQSSFGPPTYIGRLRGGMSQRNFAFSDADGMDEMIGAKTDNFLTPHRLITKRRRTTISGNLSDLALGRNASNSTSGHREESQSSLLVPMYSNGRSSVDSGIRDLSPKGVTGGLSYPGGGTHQLCASGGFRAHSLEGKVWKSLEALSLWIPVGELLSPLPAMGLEVCPALQELNVKVEGDSRLLRKPQPHVDAWGIQCLVRYPNLKKIELDMSEVTGFSLSAPEGFMDLSLWERHYLIGIPALHLTELDYWPPSDKEVNRRGMSLPAAGLLSQCLYVRKLFVHGTAHEHFLMMLNRCLSLRDVQLRGDYYPAPEQETDTELRAISCQRFEAAVAKRGFPD